ncbi:MAG: rhamnulokinase [Planctomycetia bacterium]
MDAVGPSAEVFSLRPTLPAATPCQFEDDMQTRNYLAVDLGAESGRTVLGRWDGERLALEETHRFANGPVRLKHRLSWDFLGLWRDVKVGIQRSVRAGAPVSVGIDTWGVDFGLIQENGLPVEPPLCYRGGHYAGMMDKAISTVGREALYASTGIQFLPFNSLYQWMGLAAEGPDGPLSRARRLLLVPDLLNYYLTGVESAEYTIASTTQYMDARARTWAGDLLGKLGLSPDLLPKEIVQPGTILGPLSADVALETSAASLQVVATAGHDTAAAVAAVPALGGDDWCFLSSGTWSLMGVETPQPILTPQALKGNFTNEGGVGGVIRFLKNIMGLWLVQQCRGSFARAGREYDYSTMTQMAAASPALASIINPDDPVFLNPPDMPTVIRDFCKRTGQPLPDDDAALVRCCLESLALRYRWTVEQLQANTGRPIAVIQIVGGGSQNEVLSQWTADCCRMPVVAGPVEATAVGNLLVQAMAMGELQSLDELREVVRRSFPTRDFTPRPSKAWDDAYGLFQKLIG